MVDGFTQLACSSSLAGMPSSSATSTSLWRTSSCAQYFRTITVASTLRTRLCKNLFSKMQRCSAHLELSGRGAMCWNRSQGQKWWRAACLWEVRGAQMLEVARQGRSETEAAMMLG